MIPSLALAAALLGGPALADEVEAPARDRPEVDFRYGGHVKAFGVASFLYDSPLFTEKATGSAFLDGRLNLGLDVDWFSIEAAHAITTYINASAAGGSLPISTGVGLSAPEAFPLTWTAFDEASTFRVQGRTDRLILRFSPDRVDVTLGRQPISFGSGLFFTPLDLINPFTPATVDTEYKPGVDAVRVDGYIGRSGHVTGVVAYVGRNWLGEPLDDDEEAQPLDERLAAAVHGKVTVGVTDLGVMYGMIRGDHVFGATMITGVGPVGLHADAAVTLPRPDLEEDVFFRGVVGADGRPTGTTTISGEIYVQTFGSARADDMLLAFTAERFQRSEVWLTGIAYAGLSVSQEITPLLVANLGGFVNLTDGSTLLAPAVSWSVGNNTTVAFSGFVGLGKRPEERTPTLDNLIPIAPVTEFGLYPGAAFVQISSYF